MRLLRAGGQGVDKSNLTEQKGHQEHDQPRGRRVEQIIGTRERVRKNKRDTAL